MRNHTLFKIKNMLKVVIFFLAILSTSGQLIKRGNIETPYIFTCSIFIILATFTSTTSPISNTPDKWIINIGLTSYVTNYLYPYSSLATFT